MGQLEGGIERPGAGRPIRHRRPVTRAVLAALLVLAVSAAVYGATGVGSRAVAAVTPPTVAAWWTPTTIDSGKVLTAVSCPTATFCVAVDSAGNATVLRASGWSKPTAVDPSGSLIAVSCASPIFCMAVDTEGRATTFTGSSWSVPTSIGDPGVPESVSCPSSDFCAVSDASGDVIVDSGGAWSVPDVPGSADPIPSISCVSSGWCTAVQGSSILDLRGTVWSSIADVDSRDALTGVSCASETYCMAVSAGAAFTSEGSSWSSAGPVGSPQGSVSCPVAGYCAIATDSFGNSIETVSGGTFASYPAAIDSQSALQVSCGSPSACVAVDHVGRAFLYSGAAYGPAATLGSSDLSGVSCESAQLCSAVNSTGDVFTETGGSWGPAQDIDGSQSLSGLSCVAGFCMAVDSSGDALSSAGSGWTAPTDVDGAAHLSAVSCASSTFCMAVDTRGDAVEFDGASWSTPVEIDGTTDVTTVSCPTSSFCVAGDVTGRTIVYSGAQWGTAEPTDTVTALRSISCPTSRFCAGVDDDGDGVTFNGTSWSATTSLGPEDAQSVSCLSSVSCVGIGPGGISFYDGDTWDYPAAQWNLGNSPTISCATGGCVAVGNTSAGTVVDAGVSVTTQVDATGVSYGHTVTYGATVTPEDPGAAPPSGTVTFSVGPSVLCTADLVGPSASCQSADAPVGSDVVVASYSGDGSYFAADAPPVALAVSSGDLPEVTGLGSDAGCPGGAQLTVSGQDFTGATSVLFGSTPSPSFSVVNDSTISTSIPVGAGTVDVTVVGPGGTSVPSTADQFTYGPVVTSVSGSPTGALGGGTVSINGSDFTGATSVTFGSVAAPSFDVVSNTLVQATEPEGAGTFDVRVTTPVCTSAVSTADQLYAQPLITGISPDTGSDQGGTVVTLTGAGFTGASAVTFGTATAPSVTVQSDTQMTVVTPPGISSVAVSATTPNGPTAPLSEDLFHYVAFPATGPPTITGIAPSAAAPGATVAISGTNLGQLTTLTFNGEPAYFAVQSGDLLTAIVPDGGTSGPISVEGPNGATTSTTDFSYAAPAAALPSTGCWQTVVDPETSRVFVSCPTSGTVSVFDADGGAVNTITGLSGAGGMAVVGTSVYVETPSGVAVLSARTATEKTFLPVDLGHTASLVVADHALWSLSSEGQLVKIAIPKGTTTVFTNRYSPDLDWRGLRADPASPDRVFDLGAFSTVDLSVDPPTVGIPTQLGTSFGYAIDGETDGAVSPDGSSFYLADGPLLRYDFDNLTTQSASLDTGPVSTSAVAVTAAGGGQVAGGLDQPGANQPVLDLYGSDDALEQAIGFGVDGGQEVLPRTLAFNASGTVAYAVTEDSGASADQFHAVALVPPVVTKMTGRSGPTTGGTRITLTGTGLEGDDTVFFGSTPAVSSGPGAKSGTLVAVSPPGLRGTVSIRVVTDQGSSPVTTVGQFTYK